MRFLPILEELFSSDSIIFMIIGLITSIFVGTRMKDKRKERIGLTVSILVYVCCEVLSNFHTNYMMELLLLFAGTAAIGFLIGFLIITVAAKVKNG